MEIQAQVNQLGLSNVAKLGFRFWMIRQQVSCKFLRYVKKQRYDHTYSYSSASDLIKIRPGNVCLYASKFCQENIRIETWRTLCALLFSCGPNLKKENWEEELILNAMVEYGKK